MKRPDFAEIRRRSLPRLARTASYFVLGECLELAGKAWPGRGVMPEPFDISDHMGNAWESVFAGVLVAEIASLYLEDGAGLETPHARRKVLAAGALAVAAVNFYSESRYGIGVSNWYLTLYTGGSSTPDIIDACYGTAIGVAAAYSIARAETG